MFDTLTKNMQKWMENIRIPLKKDATASFGLLLLFIINCVA